VPPAPARVELSCQKAMTRYEDTTDKAVGRPGQAVFEKKSVVDAVLDATRETGRDPVLLYLDLIDQEGSR